VDYCNFFVFEKPVYHVDIRASNIEIKQKPNKRYRNVEWQSWSDKWEWDAYVPRSYSDR